MKSEVRRAKEKGTEVRKEATKRRSHREEYKEAERAKKKEAVVREGGDAVHAG